MTRFWQKFLVAAGFLFVTLSADSLLSNETRSNDEKQDHAAVPGLGIALILDHSSLASQRDSRRTEMVEDALRTSGFIVQRVEALSRDKSLAAIDKFAKAVPTNAVVVIYYLGPLIEGEKKVNSDYSNDVFLLSPEFEFKNKRDIRSRCVAFFEIQKIFQDSGCQGMMLLADQLEQETDNEEFAKLQREIRVHRNESSLESVIAIQNPEGVSLAEQLKKESPHHGSVELTDWFKKINCHSKTNDWNPGWITKTRPVEFVRWSYFDEKNLVGNYPGEVRVNTIGQVFCWVPPGSAQIGSPKNEANRNDDEEQSITKFENGYWVGKYEVTEREYFLATRRRPTKPIGKNHPYAQSRHGDAKRFADNLNNLKPPETNQWMYVLPYEREWEYACRAGSKTAFCFGDDSKLLAAYGNFADRTLFESDPSEYRYAERGMTDRFSGAAPVGSFLPNAWGIHDMHGNVWEWCAENYLPSVTDSKNPGQKSFNDLGRVIRGGSFISVKHYCRSAMRNAQHDLNDAGYVGFRVILRGK